MMAFVRRREWLEDNAPYCPECGNGWQQQLVDHIFSKTAKWKCRLCNHRYEKEPNADICRERSESVACDGYHSPASGEPPVSDDAHSNHGQEELP